MRVFDITERLGLGKGRITNALLYRLVVCLQMTRAGLASALQEGTSS